ncbi:MAG TPA: TonB-dependent receptor [Acidobacteriaceae bacterium]|nr:TonB-dependent receptor [Acidobacteriaceae bacterium]
MREICNRLCTLFLALVVLAFFATPVLHGQTAVDGAIGGTVMDSSGAVVSGSAVTVRNVATNAQQTATTDSNGYYRIIHLQPGVYSVSISAPGFRDYKATDVTVQVGSMTDVEGRMEVGTAAQTVEVTGEAPIINTTSADFAGVVDQVPLKDLPENNYRWSAFALLTPGVTNDSNGYGLLSFRGASTLLNNVTIDGTDDNQAYFSEERGRTRAGYSTIKDSVQEFQVNTSNYSSEYGRSAGGIVNSVTKSGTNAFHGDVYYFDRDSDWNAQNYYVQHPVQTSPGHYTAVPFKPTDLRRQYGFTVGGPLLKNRLFFFLGADRFYHDFPGAATITGTSANANFYTAPDATLPAGKVCGVTSGTTAPNYQDSNVCQFSTNTGLSYADAASYYSNGIASMTSMLGQVARTGDQTIYFPKIDWQINDKNRASVEANRMRWTSPAGIQTSPAVAYGMSSFGNDYVRDNWIVGKLDTFLTPTFSNEVRYMYGRDFEFEFNQTPTSYEQNNLVKTANYTNSLGLPANVYLSGFFQFGTPQFLNRAALPDERRWQIADTLEWIHGNHDVRFGGDYIHTYDLISNLYNQYGGFTYSGNTPLGNYLADLYLSQNPQPGKTAEHYTYFNQGAGLPGLEFTSGDYSLFVQDEWKIRPRLSLTGGLRWEFEKMPDPMLANSLVPATSKMPSNKGNIGPRVGFAYDVFGHGTTVVRGGYGFFFARAINATIYQNLIVTGASGSQTNPQFNPGAACAPQFPQVVPPSSYGSCLLGASGNATVYFFDKNFRLPAIYQGDLSLQQQITKNDVFGLSWLGSWGRRLPDFVDTNLPAPTQVSFTISDPGGKGPLADGTTLTTNAYLGKRPNTNFSSITDTFSGVTSNYEALVAQFQHRMSHYASFSASYTWSHALDYGENNNTAPTANALLDPANLKLDYGNSNQNVPNRLMMYSVLDSPWHVHGPLGYLANDFQLAPTFQFQSGLPYSMGISGSQSKLYLTPGATAQGSLVSTGSFNGSNGANRVPFVDRNVFNMPHTVGVDLRASKRFVVKERYSLEFLAEAFNLANHQNVTGIGATAYSVALDNTNHVNQLTPYTSTPFQSVTSTDNSNFAYNVRQLQMALRFQF